MRNKLPWILVGILSLIIIGLLFNFVVRGSVVNGTDGRTAIMLETGEKDFILTEMRAFLSTVQQLNQALANEDLATAATIARASGMDAVNMAPGPMMAKLPASFMQLGLSTHGRFDDLADLAETSDSSLEVLAELSSIMQNCVGCHAAYRLDIEP
ncbi:MAG TPA: hypothetical protein ENJ56_00200 [Anaerolineae bacterium]|nr:hypothetical protein [Anaerolineae bacterium]